ncbi:MAG TPA: acetyl-CoA hydrolase/transferase C-terminal domain-containing protein [Steroidobacteraceae bacterium]|jgi:acyl-CoA hydrolase|nr:acetyl-CoA hydrolase/transferase C-terminal domain-containing protein [Steroidobacteraceae bacterium]
MPRIFDDVAECVEDTLGRVGPRIVLGLPLGIGKPNPLVNEFYRRARRDPSITLKIFTALSLRAPQWHGELERLFLQPLVERLFGGCVPLDYVRDLHRAEVPENVQISEFFLDPGALLDVAHAQRHYVSTNYTHVARELAAQGVNVIAQLVAKRGSEGRAEYSLGSNPDVTVDLLEILAPQRRQGRSVIVIGEVNRQMPFMFGPAAVDAETFDSLIEHPRYDYDLFAPPNKRLSTSDYAIGLYCARLVRDGGTLQIGIGELGDAVVYGLQLRQQQNVEFLEILQGLKATQRFGPTLDSIGGEAPFDSGLYGCTEMFVDGFLDLYRSGVLRRRVYDDLRIQQLLNSGAVGERVDEPFLAALAGAGFGSPLDEREFVLLQRFGVFRQECRYAEGFIENSEGLCAAALHDTTAARRQLLALCTGRQLTQGILLHGAFFLGPRGFYAALRDLPETERRQFCMSGVAFVNQLDGADQALKIAQRKNGRFINSSMMATLLGAAVSDGLADGRVVSGVGGQYNFVAMAHSLPGARSILTARSTRMKNATLTSNILWNYGNTTIPRHLRDVVVTEYGVADLRGRSDQEVIAAMLNIADSRFQDELKRQAQDAGKLPRDHQIPEMHRNNTPRALEERFILARARGLFSEFPFGTDFTAEEIVLAKALANLQEHTRRRGTRLKTLATALTSPGTPAHLRPYLTRMALHAPQSRQQWLWQRLLVQELRRIA